QTVALADGEAVQAAPGVARAQELGQVGGVEGDEVADLMPLGLRDRHPLAGPHPPQARVSGGDDQLSTLAAHGLSSWARSVPSVRGGNHRPDLAARRWLVVAWGELGRAGPQQPPEEGAGPLLSRLAEDLGRAALLDDAA